MVGASAEKKQQQEEQKNKEIDIEAAMVKFIVKDRLPISKLNSVHLNNLVQSMCCDFFYFLSCTRKFQIANLIRFFFLFASLFEQRTRSKNSKW